MTIYKETSDPEKRHHKSIIVTQITDCEQRAFAKTIKPVLDHITYCGEFDLYFLDGKHLDAERTFEIRLMPDELEGLKKLYPKLAGREKL